MHPALVPLDQLALIESRLATISARTAYGYELGWGLPPAADIAALSVPPAPATGHV